jgi:hypothetical protein
LLRTAIFEDEALDGEAAGVLKNGMRARRVKTLSPR